MLKSEALRGAARRFGPGCLLPAHGQVQSILFASRDRSAGNAVLVSSVRSIARLHRLRIESANRVQEVNTPAPIMRAKKNSFRSAPMRVSGRLRDRKTGLCLRSMAFPPNSDSADLFS